MIRPEMFLCDLRKEEREKRGVIPWRCQLASIALSGTSVDGMLLMLGELKVFNHEDVRAVDSVRYGWLNGRSGSIWFCFASIRQ
eukprot:1158802-Pelagomonas_calceolata.AAC.9